MNESPDPDLEGAGRAVRMGAPAPFEEHHDQDAWLESYSEWRVGNSLPAFRKLAILAQPLRRRSPCEPMGQSSHPPGSLHRSFFWCTLPY